MLDGELTLYMRHPVINTPEYTCVFDEFRYGDEQIMLVHLDIHKFTKSSLRRGLRDWSVLRQSVSVPLFAYGENDDAKYEHFMSLLGFQHISFIPCTDGRTRRVYVSFPLEVSDNAAVHHHHEQPKAGTVAATDSVSS